METIILTCAVESVVTRVVVLDPRLFTTLSLKKEPLVRIRVFFTLQTQVGLEFVEGGIVPCGRPCLAHPACFFLVSASQVTLVARKMEK